MSQNEIVIIGGNYQEAADYYHREALYGQAVILDNARGLGSLAGRKPGLKVVLVGQFHDRADANELIKYLANRGAKFEDLTTEVKHV